MRLIILAFSLIFCWQISSASAQEIAVIKSTNIKPYNEALEGFKNVCNADIEEYVLSDSDSSKILRDIHKNKPDLILTIGLNALSEVMHIRDIPIVYTMVSNPKSVLSGERNITGISMNISAEKQINALFEFLPTLKRIGIVYDPERTIHLFEEAKDSASSLGISIVSQAVHNPKEVPTAIKDMTGKIDAFWMLPDATVINQETTKYLLLFSFENRIPVLAFSDKYVELGFLLSLDTDHVDIGQQAGELANRVLSGIDVSTIPMSSPRKAVLSLNPNTAKKLGIRVDKEIIKKINITYLRGKQ